MSTTEAVVKALQDIYAALGGVAGAVVAKIKDSAGNNLTSTGNALDVNLKTPATVPVSAASLPLPSGAATETTLGYETRKQVQVNWAANDGTVEIVVATGWAAGTQVDLVGFFAVLSASPGAATWIAHMSATTGWTIGDYTEHYQSEDAPATPVASPIQDSIPNAPAMFVVPASGNLFLRVVPDAGTTSGNADIFLKRVRG